MKNKGTRFSDSQKNKDIIYDADSREADIPTTDDLPDEDVKAYRHSENIRSRKRDEQRKKNNEKKTERIVGKRQKKGGRHKRESLLAEDMPQPESTQDDIKKEQKLPVKKRPIIIAVIIVAVLALAVLLFSNSDILSFDSIKNFFQYGLLNQDSDERFPINIQGENISAGNFDSMGNYLVYVSDSKLVTVNNYGKTIYTESMAMSSPILATCDNYILLYNLGGTGYEIDSLDKSIHSSTAENKILVGDISDSGVYALVTQSDAYLSKLYVYNKEHEQIFAYSYADYYITSVALNSTGTRAAVSGVSALDGAEISAVYIHDFTQEDPQLFNEINGDIIYDLKYLSDSVLCAVGKNAAYGIRTGSGDIETTSYEGKSLTGYDINTDTDTFSVSLSRSGDGRNCDVYNFNSSGKLSSSFSTDLRIISLSTYKNRVAALSSDSVYLYSKDGKLISEKEAGLDTHAVILYSGSNVYVLSSSDINTLGL